MQLEQGSRPESWSFDVPATWNRPPGRDAMAVGPRSHRYWRDHHRAILAETWELSGDNKVVKAAAATFVGVPAGLYGEVKQIIVGTPTDVRY